MSKVQLIDFHEKELCIDRKLDDICYMLCNPTVPVKISHRDFNCKFETFNLVSEKTQSCFRSVYRCVFVKVLIVHTLDKAYRWQSFVVVNVLSGICICMCLCVGRAMPEESVA